LDLTPLLPQDIDFTVAEVQSGTLFAGKGFCAVFQNDDRGLGAFSDVENGFGYAGIENSIAVCTFNPGPCPELASER
jgi:hypothetical protein